jgi:hypothetical protein
VKKADNYHLNEDGLFDDDDDDDDDEQEQEQAKKKKQQEKEEDREEDNSGGLFGAFSILQQGFETSVNVAEDITRTFSMSRNDVTESSKKTRRQSSFW